MVRFRTADGPVWAVQIVGAFLVGGRRFPAGSWIVGDMCYLRVAMTDEQFKERRAALEVTPRRIA